MPSFRSPKAQSDHAVSQKVALGKGRHDHRDDGKIHSVGTARGYEQVLKGVAEYQQEHRLGDLRTLTVDIAQQYLNDRAAERLHLLAFLEDRAAARSGNRGG